MTSEGGHRCTLHPDRPAAALCTRCLKPICDADRRASEDGLAVCRYTAEGLPCPALEEAASSMAHGQPLDEPTAPDRPAATYTPGPRALIPWESPGEHPSPAGALWATLVRAVTAPFQLMEQVPWVRGDWRTPLIFALLCSVLGQAGLTLQGLLAGRPLWISPTLLVLDHLTGLSESLSSLVLLPIIPLAAMLELAVITTLVHTGLGLYGGERRPPEATFRVFAYGRVTYLLLLLPAIGHIIAALLDVILLISGLRLAHKASFARALFALALPFLLRGALLLWVGQAQA